MRPVVCAQLLAGVILAAHFAASPALGQLRGAPEPTDAQRARHARRLLTDARAFLRQDRVESAERALRRGLAGSPDDPQLHDLLARVLARQGRAEESTRHRRLADELAPPPPPLPTTPLAAPSRGLLVALVPPGSSAEPPDRIASDWPKGLAAKTLEARLRLRLPRADIAHFSPESVAEARSWLAERAPRSAISLRVDRFYCTETVKDGPFAVAWLRLAAELPGAPSAGPDERRELVLNPRAPGDCRAEALGRALERAFKHAITRRALAAPDAREQQWSTLAIRALFPGLGERIKRALDRGREQLAAGRVGDAAATFRNAALIDPEDPVLLAYLAEAEATLALARELTRGRDTAAIREEDRGVLDPRFSPEQRAAAEARLAEERRRREDLLAAQKVLREKSRGPEAATLAALRWGEIHDPDAFGPSMARQRAGGAVGVRVAYAPDGGEIARYYLPDGGEQAVLREDDVDGDGRPDRWVAYHAGARSDIWEDGSGSGAPDLHFVFALGGEPLDRIELDTDEDGRTDRIIHYADGVLRAESWDNDGDGVLDRFDRFDDDGNVETRLEDLDGDGRIDVRSTYRGGRLLERTFQDDELVPEDL